MFHKSVKKSISSKRCGRESVEFMLSKEGNRLPFTLGINRSQADFRQPNWSNQARCLGSVDALTARVLDTVTSGELHGYSLRKFF